MSNTGVLRGPHGAKVSDDRLQEILDEFPDMSLRRMASYLLENDKIEIKFQALGPRVKALRKRLSPRTREGWLPWRVAARHAQGWMYIAVLAWAKRQAGEEVKGAPLQKAKDLEAYCRSAGKHGLVVTYCPHNGIVFVNRRPEDDPASILTTRQPPATGLVRPA